MNGRSTRARLARAATALGAALALACAGAQTAGAADPLGVVPGSFAVTPSTTQAGGHPDVTVRFELTAPATSTAADWPGVARDVTVDLPPGIVGDPTAVPRCTQRQWAAASCPPSTQIGTIDFGVLGTASVVPATEPVYNLEPARGRPAEFGFRALSNLPIKLLVAVRGEDQGLRTTIKRLPGRAPLASTGLTLWGVPADPSHDPLRGRSCLMGNCAARPGGLASDAPRRPFLANVATCDAPGLARMSVDTYERPDVVNHAEAPYPQATGCAAQQFTGSGSVRAEEPRAGAPSGYRIRLAVGQSDDPDGLATPPLKRAVLTLPEGVVVSPSVADGLQACSDAQLGLGADAPPTCPAASKIGSVSIDSPLLDEPLVGPVHLLQPTDAQLLRIALVAERDGVLLKLPGRIDADPATGRLTAVFDQNPQLPFSSLDVTLKGGARAVLANPRQCGPATSAISLEPFGGGAIATSSDTFEVSADGAGAPCGATGFGPSFSAGSDQPVAGAATPFTLRVARGDGDDLLGRIDATLPPGVLPRLAGVPLCAEAQAVAGTCDEGSRIGGVDVLAGPGERPYGLPGRVYVGGAFDGAPYSLVIVVPALAGPFDLGAVVVRAAVHVDRRTAQLRVVSQPLPTIVRGIPLQLRALTVRIDRAGFMLAPTSCAPRSTRAAIGAAGGAVAAVESRYQVGGCASLPYAPRLAVRVGAKGRTATGRATPLRATLTQPAGQAASRRVRLVLPSTINARMEVVRRACEQAAFDAGTCGTGARVGSGTALTSLLAGPLSGPAYLVRNPARRLPDLVVRLRGEGIEIDLVGAVQISRRLQLTTTFDAIPDVPLSRFELTLPAGNSPVGAAASLCTKAAKRATARQTLRGQNGRLVQRKARLTIDGCTTAKARARARAKAVR